jgi:hypothetical protein
VICPVEAIGKGADAGRELLTELVDAVLRSDSALACRALTEYARPSIADAG